MAALAEPFAFFARRPAPPLDRFVATIWAVRGSAGYRRAAVLPNGAIQLMVNFGAPHGVTAIADRRADLTFARAWIAGMQEAPLAIVSPLHSDLLAIRFRPGGAHAFLPVPPSAIANDVVDAQALLGADVDELRERLCAAPTRERQAAAVEAWLLARLRPREPAHSIVQRAVTMLGQRALGESVAGACVRLGVSNRWLIRMFRDTVGVPPKTYARIRRFHEALRRLPASSRADLALDLGYADQAHFNHEFRRFSAVAPGAFLRLRGEDGESLVLG